MSWIITGTQKLDPEAAAYIGRVEQADQANLEPAVKDTINAFVVGCKTDGIWSSIKASCILAGARTLNGALQPLAGPSPTNNGPFNAIDYDRKTGLLGNGSTKYLNSGFNNTLTDPTDPLNNVHIAFFPTQVNNGSIGVGSGASSGATHITAGAARNRNSASVGYTYQTGALIGSSRNNNSNFTLRAAGTSTIINIATTGQALIDANHYIYARNELPAPGQFSSGRMAFYSIGSSVDLALLDSRVTTLINAFAAAIP